MLILPRAGLVLIEVPKTASQSIRRMLRGHARLPGPSIPRHAGAAIYAARLAPRLARRFGRAPETVAVVREPVEWLASWFRYRQRDKVAGRATSTRGMDFEHFVREALRPDPPPFAVIGSPARMLGWDGRQAGVDHLFDHARLDLLVAFLAARTGAALVLPRRNASPAPEAVPTLAPATLAALRAARAGDFALHAAVAAAGGQLSRPGGSAP